MTEKRTKKKKNMLNKRCKKFNKRWRTENRRKIIDELKGTKKSGKPEDGVKLDVLKIYGQKIGRE